MLLSHQPECLCYSQNSASSRIHFTQSKWERFCFTFSSIFLYCPSGTDSFQKCHLLPPSPHAHQSLPLTFSTWAVPGVLAGLHSPVTEGSYSDGWIDLKGPLETWRTRVTTSKYPPDTSELAQQTQFLSVFWDSVPFTQREKKRQRVKPKWFCFEQDVSFLFLDCSEAFLYCQDTWLYPD